MISHMRGQEVDMLMEERREETTATLLRFLGAGLGSVPDSTAPHPGP